LPHEPALAAERCVAFLLSQGLEQRCARDGRRVGIQSTLALSPTGEGAIELYDLLDGEVGGSDAPDQTRRDWAKVARNIEDKLGFSLEPELFSNMLFVAHTADMPRPHVQRLALRMLDTFKNSDARGLYHFFTSLRFACDIDCTGVAARARLMAGDIDLESAEGRRELRQITDRILRSAAVTDVGAEQNRSHGKDNGPLTRHVFKVYLDDHGIQGREYDRGLKNNPVVVANALFPVLFELSRGRRRLDEAIPLCEYFDGAREPRTGQATVAEIVAANLRYVQRHLVSDDLARGCRYYASPDAFLCFYSELIRHFGPMTAVLGSTSPLVRAIEERRDTRADGVGDPHFSLNAALRAIAAGNVGLDRTPELRTLLDRQAADGGWPDFGALYTLGTSETASVYFGSPSLTCAFALRAFSDPSPLDGRCLRRDSSWMRVVRELSRVSH
jgi:hypothetical protein